MAWHWPTASPSWAALPADRAIPAWWRQAVRPPKEGNPCEVSALPLEAAGGRRAAGIMGNLLAIALRKRDGLMCHDNPGCEAWRTNALSPNFGMREAVKFSFCYIGVRQSIA